MRTLIMAAMFGLFSFAMFGMSETIIAVDYAQANAARVVVASR